MTTVWVRLTLGLVVVLSALVSVLIGATRFLPHAADDAALSELLASPSGCASPCWQGIHPNTTDYQTAIDLLQSNPRFVQLDTRQTLYAGSTKVIWYIYWTWRDTSSEAISGSLMIQAGIVRMIHIDKQIPFGLLWMLLGKPDQGSFIGTLVYRGSTATDLPLYHTALYASSEISIQTGASCADFWWQLSTLMVGGASENGRAYDLSAYRRFACTGWAA